MKFLKLLNLLVFYLLSSTLVFAHPGHGSESIDPNSVLHYVTSLVHLIPLVTVLGIILFSILRKRAVSATSRRIFRK